MTRSASMWLMVLVPCVLAYAGTARAQYLPSPNASESPGVIEPSLFDPNSIGTPSRQFVPRPNAAESTPTNEPSSFDANSVLTARAQYLPPPNAPQNPIFVQPPHVALSSSFDADSLGNRNVYVDGTFAPFGGIFESGVRVRLTGTASWYRFVTSEDPRILGSGHYLEGGLLAGYGIWGPGFGVNWLVGPAFGEGVNDGAVTDRWGAKALIEMYARPTVLTMASASVTYSTIGNNLQVQAKAGLRIFGDVYFGPETKFTWQQILPFQVNFFTPAIATTTPISPQTSIATTRVGAHISALNIGPILIGVSGGWVHDRQLGSGYYGSVNFYQPF